MDDDKQDSGVAKEVTREKFAGSLSCSGCHKDVYEQHLKTAHFQTSGLPSADNIKGSFDTGKNSYAFNNSVVVRMEKRDSGFYQVEYFRGVEKKARRFDIVVGSGTMGQSFLNWNGNHLFQLPITYFTAANQWSNSPGFPDRVVFNRVITSRCMECHSTYAETISTPGKEPEQFDHQKMIYGVDCEKCHGPAKDHVAFHTEYPEDTLGKFIVNPATLSRQQNLDLCALCHGGRLQKTKPSFQFVAGKNLSDYFNVDTSVPDPDKIDVHGNQYGLLRASECFKMSSTLTCNSCHDPHQNEKGKLQTFSNRCMNCHSEQKNNFCKMAHTLGPVIKTNCVDCHMPVKPSRAIAVFLPNARTPTAALIRSHFIAVYPEESKRLISEFISRKGAK